MTEHCLTGGTCQSKTPPDSGAMQEPMTGRAARALMQRTRTMCDPLWKHPRIAAHMGVLSSATDAYATDRGSTAICLGKISISPSAAKRLRRCVPVAFTVVVVWRF